MPSETNPDSDLTLIMMIRKKKVRSVPPSLVTVAMPVKLSTLTWHVHSIQHLAALPFRSLNNVFNTEMTVRQSDCFNSTSLTNQMNVSFMSWKSHH